MKKLVAIIAVTIVALAGCTSMISPTTRGSGVKAAEDRVVGRFTGIEAVGSVRVSVKRGEKPACTVKGDDNIVAMVATEVSGGVLRIEAKGSIDPVVPLEVEVVAPRIDSVVEEGSGMLVVGDFVCEALEARVKGSGSIRGGRIETVSLDAGVNGSGKLSISDLAARDATLGLSGSGAITVSGRAEHLMLRQAGSGASDLAGLCVDNAAVEVSGSGDATVSVAKTLRAQVTGSGDIACLGEPALKISRDVNGSGTVRLIGSGNCFAD